MAFTRDNALARLAELEQQCDLSESQLGADAHLMLVLKRKHEPRGQNARVLPGCFGRIIGSHRRERPNRLREALERALAEGDHVSIEWAWRTEDGLRFAEHFSSKPRARMGYLEFEAMRMVRRIRDLSPQK